MITTVEGVYKRGKIELFETPAGVQESRVLVTFLPKAITPASPRRMIYGQFTGKPMSTEDDFRLSEWHGEAKMAIKESLRQLIQIFVPLALCQSSGNVL